MNFKKAELTFFYSYRTASRPYPSYTAEASLLDSTSAIEEGDGIEEYV